MLKFFVALAVVMIVSILSLGWRVGIVVAAAVPLTLAAVFVIMLLTGRVFDRITLGALILGLGLLVDDAIISDRKSTRLNSSHTVISYAVFCLKKKKLSYIQT